MPIFTTERTLAGRTAGEVLAELDALERDPVGPSPAARLQVLHDLADAGMFDRRPPLLARLWARLRQAWCAHPAATAYRVPGAIPPVFERRCGRCGAHWVEVG